MHAATDRGKPGRWYAAGVWDASQVWQVLGACQPAFPWIPQGLEPPVPLALVEQFESVHGVRLPLEYRSFVTQVGAGGAGPSDRLFRFDRSDVAPAAPQGWFGFLNASGFYGSAFVHPDGRAPAPAVGAPDLRSMAGTFALAEVGGIWEFLVLGGPMAGQVWRGDPVEMAPVRRRPARPGEPGWVAPMHNFATWYGDWLDRLAVQQLERTEIRTGWSTYLSVDVWQARLVHNEIRRHDESHEFVTVASESNHLFELVALERLGRRRRRRFTALLRTIADDLAAAEPPVRPLRPYLTPAATADLVRTIADQLS